MGDIGESLSFLTNKPHFVGVEVGQPREAAMLRARAWQAAMVLSAGACFMSNGDEMKSTFRFSRAAAMRLVAAGAQV